MSTPSHVYYNARLDNYEAPGQASFALPAVFSDTRPAPLIQTASDYELSIVRFQTSLQSLPCLIVEHPTQAGSTPAITSYEFTVINGAVTVALAVQWTPANPVLIQQTGDYFDAYWYEYNFIRFGQLVNTCIAAAVLAAGYMGPAPNFSYNVANATWSLNYTIDFVDITAGGLHLLANAQSAHLFAGFPMTKQGNLFMFNLLPQYGENQDANHYYQRTQTPGSLTTWNPVRRFVFTTQTLPVLSESINSVTNYTNGIVPVGLASQPILSDLTPELIRGDELRSGVLSYTPTAEYRMIELRGDQQIREIDFAVLWEDALGNLHPHILLHNDYVSAKLMFRKK